MGCFVGKKDNFLHTFFSFFDEFFDFFTPFQTRKVLKYRKSHQKVALSSIFSVIRIGTEVHLYIVGVEMLWEQKV